MIIFTNGVLDVLTIGHFNLLMKCRHLAGANGKVVVAVDEDEKVMLDKGFDRPIFNCQERVKALLDLKMPDGSPVVNQIETFHTNLELEMLIRRVAPDYIVKGGDWQDKKVIGSQFAKVRFVGRLGGYSTTEIVKRCLEKNGQAQR